MQDVYADVSRNAISTSLRLNRIARGDSTPEDQEALSSVGDGLRRLADGEWRFSTGGKLFSTLEGQMVMVIVAKEFVRQKHDDEVRDVKAFLASLSDKLQRASHRNSVAFVQDAEEPLVFFRQVHALAEEIAVTGVQSDTDPILELYKTLT